MAHYEPSGVCSNGLSSDHESIKISNVLTHTSVSDDANVQDLPKKDSNRAQRVDLVSNIRTSRTPLLYSLTAAVWYIRLDLDSASRFSETYHLSCDCVPLAFCTSASIFCIVSLSYGRVEEFEVITSAISILELRCDRNRIPEFTDTAMRQYSHKLIIDRRLKTATLKNIWIERPVGPGDNISSFN